ncbi:MAG: (Fe-S)-binding protein [Opitutaceae bacterium]|nr:(Fe-S)-binding protein [Opitutaceae bacterium]
MSTPLPTKAIPAKLGVGPHGLAALDYSILQQCMHCGMCLPSCPTYLETKRERHSPRGRIALMRAIADGEYAVTREFGEEMYYCLGCLACTTACPAGVNYAELFETARADIEQHRVLDTPARRGIRWFALRLVFTRPRLLKVLGRLLWLYQRSGVQTLLRKIGLFSLLPRRLRELEKQTPEVRTQFSDSLVKEVEAPYGPKRHRVAVLTGCVQDILFSEINHATVEVLRENGCEVFTPRNQYCCGSLHAHNGDPEAAKDLARRQIEMISPESVDAIITNAGGCGSHLKHYDTLLADDPRYAARARIWSNKVHDIHEWLVKISFRKPKEAPQQDQVITYHESCHLCHGQKIVSQPREILRSLPGMTLRECAQSSHCCGSAGIYNLTQPATAASLQAQKVARIRETGAHVVATSNPGCHLQLQIGLRDADDSMIEVSQPVLLLARAYAEERRHRTMKR